MIVAHLSDLHVKEPGRVAYRAIDTAACLQRAVARIAALDPLPDLTIASGDLADAGRPAEYAHLRALLAPLPTPVYLVMGNHDDRTALRAAFPDHAYLHGEPDAPVQYAIDGPLRIVVADTTIPGEDGGELDDERLGWIDAALAADAGRPALLVLHHPPFRTGIRGMDDPPFRGAEALGAVVRRHPHLERVVCGHLHRPIVTRWNGTLAATVPSTAHQVTFDLRPGDPTFTLEPPAFALHVWDGTGVVSHVVPVDVSAGPYPFREGGHLIT